LPLASPVVEVDAKLADRGEALKIIGIDVFRAGAVQPGLIGTPATGWIICARTRFS
jgi:putative ABC transport system permease protein